ncbi:MAG: hypothetical protein AB8I08_37815 [Sandaracinaceae bacterium]
MRLPMGGTYHYVTDDLGNETEVRDDADNLVRYKTPTSRGPR